MVVNAEIESIQIQALQKIIRCQDSLLQSELRDSNDICAVWKNECYRLSIEKKIAEDEAVRIGTACVELLKDQRESIFGCFRQGLEDCMRLHSRTVLEALSATEARVRKVERDFRRLQRKMEDACSERSVLLSREMSLLAKRNIEVERQIELMRAQANEVETVNRSESIKRMPTGTPKKGKDVAVSASPGTVEEVHLLLAELKALESEAKQMLIKP
jgi:actin-like ATPase involved in cell morphogenesis